MPELTTAHAKKRIAAGVSALLAVAGTALAGPAQAGQAASATVGWSDSADGTGIGNAMYQTNADIMRNDGWTGKGIGVAMIDTGVAPVAGLTGGNVVNGPDLSFESQDPATRYVDRNGHGTHLAGIIAGRPSGSFAGGVAPNAKLTSLKVGAANGAVDVSQVLAAIDWVVEHRNDDPYNKIRVLQLSYGTDSTQATSHDPLQLAVENAWKAGIVVVVASGNAGGQTAVLNPASDPSAIAVGALDTRSTPAQDDDIVTPFTNRGSSARRIDLSAPGRTILSLRAPGSYIDTNFPSARVGTQLFKGSGTSQAAAMMAGNIALLLQAKPTLTPDQVKSVLVKSSAAVASTGSMDNGLRRIDLFRASITTPSTTTVLRTASGKGTLEGSRGTIHVSDGTTQLTGEKTVWGAFDAAAWAAASKAGTAWNGTTWMGQDLVGSGWVVASGGLSSWSGRTWSGRTWSGRTWSGQSWSTVSWLGGSWN